MQVSFQTFRTESRSFSFHDDPVLVVEDFWSEAERKRLLAGIQHTQWRALSDLPSVRAAFPNCGNWTKGQIEQPDVALLLERLSLPCIANYIESFPHITRRHMSFHYYAYAPGDCLLTHDDTVQASTGQGVAPPHEPLRRLALVTYLHDNWQMDWGGELIIYDAHRQAGSGRPRLSISHCIAPTPGSLVLFTVPRFHRVCRVDPLSGEHKRLSIAGWFMTEHEPRGSEPELQLACRTVR